MRLERVAYKKIAGHLDKTELACRLHYHQLSHGNNRRKRNNSISSTSSNASVTSPAASPSSSSTPLAKTRSSSPTISSFSPVNASGAIQKVGTTAQPKIKGKPLLPKPHGSTGPTSSTSPGKNPGSNKAKQLRVDCSPDAIDKDKLIRIVEKQRAMFWESVATQYGGSVDADFLQKCWQKGFTSTSSATTPTSAITAPSSAISALTTTTTTTPTTNTTPSSAVTVTPLTPAISPSTKEAEDGAPGEDGAASSITTVSEVSTPDLSPTASVNGDSSTKDDMMEEVEETRKLEPSLTAAARSVDCVMRD
ncbi:unnamed protein product [Tuber melanosporum]|uniref:(Perigord truffle) hypothetical protein n=1 Tax=Tuber melanosporum (strain Mel28) TaxID=656061 RepID=D5GG73_TUBMM|nr:uncharacterized protein GSTUM_00007243001 [Tuber melanosporum]CAZ83516.1 unnamed protein product [Tuber melanosporum]